LDSRTLDALAFGLEMRSPGYHLFAADQQDEVGQDQDGTLR
jgi:hypothetical protein